MADPTKRRIRCACLRSLASQFGARLNVPYFIAAGDDTDILLTPALMSKQGLLVAGSVDHRFANGSIEVKASGLKQLDPGAYAGTVGDIDWRGSAQTTGQFTPIATWTVGWSYTTFTDAAYLNDYHFEDNAKNLVDEAYATHVARDEFFVPGAAVQPARQRHAGAAGLAGACTARCEPAGTRDFGEIDLTASLLGVQRGADDTLGTLNGVKYQAGYAEEKAHAMVEADWRSAGSPRRRRGHAAAQVASTRRGYADYTDTSVSPSVERQVDLFNATPIAAVDVRFPMVARAKPGDLVIEPIAQLVYRASDVTDLGITNDSFVFDDTNLFSYNRFTGTDRQETGLRANLGGHYQANFDGGQWLDVIGGQSFQLAGTNAFAATDLTPGHHRTRVVGERFLHGARCDRLAAPQPHLRGQAAGRSSDFRITRSGLGSAYSIAGWNFNADYLYIAQDLARGVLTDQQEIAGGVSVPLFDYWRVSTHASWDIAADSWLDAGGGVHYDDGYLRYGGDVEATGPTNGTPNDLRFTASFDLKGLGGLAFWPRLTKQRGGENGLPHFLLT